MLFRTLANWSGFAGWPVARAMRKLNCSRRSLRRSSPRSLGAFARKSFAFMVVPSRSNLAFDECRGHGKLRRRKPECLAGDLLAHAFDLEQHFAGQHPGDPVFDVALAGSHAHFERLLRDRYIREHADPDSPAALHVARDGAARRLDFASGHAAAIGGLEAVFAERDKIAALRAARNLALELFAEFSPLRLHHVSLPCIQPAAGAAAVVGAVDAASISASGASASG